MLNELNYFKHTCMTVTTLFIIIFCVAVTNTKQASRRRFKEAKRDDLKEHLPLEIFLNLIRLSFYGFFEKIKMLERYYHNRSTCHLLYFCPVVSFSYLQSWKLIRRLSHPPPSPCTMLIFAQHTSYY